MPISPLVWTGLCVPAQITIATATGIRYIAAGTMCCDELAALYLRGAPMSKLCLRRALLSSALSAIGLSTTSGFALGPVEYELEPLYSGFPGPDDDFGYSLAIDGGYIAIGARFDDIDGQDSGAVYVYNRTGRNFLYAPFAADVGPGDLLGYSVAIDNGFLYATAPNDDVDGVIDAGSVFVFDLFSNGFFHRRLNAPVLTRFDNYGWHVSASNGLVMVGAPSTLVGGVQSGVSHAYLSSSFTYLTSLVPSDGTSQGFFGTHTEITGDYVVVGSSRNDIGVGIGESGSAYVYDYASGNLLHKLIPNDPQAGTQFGSSIAIQGNLIAIGAPFTNDRGPNSGSVYLFDAITGNQVAKIIADDTDDFDWFGHSVAMDDDVLVIGATYNDTTSAGRGSVYMYDINTLSMIDKIDIPVFAGTSDRFGSAVAAGEGDILTSNYNQFDNGLETGVAYFVDAICDADLNDDGTLDFFDVSDLLSDEPDYNGDGVFDFFDVSAFLSDYQMGCP